VNEATGARGLGKECEGNATERGRPGQEVSKGKERRKEERYSPTNIHKKPPIIKRIDEDDDLLGVTSPPTQLSAARSVRPSLMSV
jgi:hypothetical protein